MTLPEVLFSLYCFIAVVWNAYFSTIIVKKDLYPFKIGVMGIFYLHLLFWPVGIVWELIKKSKEQK